MITAEQLQGSMGKWEWEVVLAVFLNIWLEKEGDLRDIEVTWEDILDENARIGLEEMFEAGWLRVRNARYIPSSALVKRAESLVTMRKLQ